MKREGVRYDNPWPQARPTPAARQLARWGSQCTGANVLFQASALFKREFGQDLGSRSVTPPSVMPCSSPHANSSGVSSEGECEAFVNNRNCQNIDGRAVTCAT